MHNGADGPQGGSAQHGAGTEDAPLTDGVYRGRTTGPLARPRNPRSWAVSGTGYGCAEGHGHVGERRGPGRAWLLLWRGLDRACAHAPNRICATVGLRSGFCVANCVLQLPHQLQNATKQRNHRRQRTERAEGPVQTQSSPWLFRRGLTVAPHNAALCPFCWCMTVVVDDEHAKR